MDNDENIDDGDLDSPREMGPLAAILGKPAEPMLAPVAPESRYAGIRVASVLIAGQSDADSQRVVYLQRRFVPPASRFASLRFYRTVPGERVDQVASRELGDPLAFWKICDANHILRPLNVPESSPVRLRIPLPEGVPPAT